MTEITVKLYFCRECGKHYKTLRHFAHQPTHDYAVIEKKYNQLTLDKI